MLNRHFRSVDIIKGIAMIMVIMVHYQQNFDICKWFRYCQMGVPIFFVCSGFGIMCLISNKFSGTFDNKAKHFLFYFSRYKALAPGWYMTILFVFLADTLLICIGKPVYALASNRDPMAIVVNIAFLHGLVPSCNNTVVPGGWYIGTTAILYFLTPFTLTAMQRFKNRRIFFVITFFTGVTVWIGMNTIFADAFSYKDFSYFFFSVHYPEYLLGIMLHEDMKDSVLNEKQVRRCLPIGLMIFGAAYVMFYSQLPYRGYFSAWITASATYVILYYMISTEDERVATKFGNMLSSFGRNSYGIFLLHVFFAWRFVLVVEKLANRMNFSIKNVPGFILLLPVVLALCYAAGATFNKIIKKITDAVFQ